MKVVLEAGDTLEVELAGTDGTFSIAFGDDELTVKTDLPDDDGRSGTIYRERFGSVRVKTSAKPCAAAGCEKPAIGDGIFCAPCTRQSRGGAVLVGGPEE